MSGYTSIMVQAYSLTTGKTIQDSLADLSIDSLIGPSEINHNSPEDKSFVSSLLENAAGISAWGKIDLSQKRGEKK